MSSENWRRAEELFLAAADLPEDERALFLDRECAADPALRLDVESLLAYDRCSDTSIAETLEQAAGTLLGWGQETGKRFGAYRVTEQLGAGGMGTVYLAQRDDDEYQKRVAIKLANTSVGPGYLRERLRQERQILAGLDHPYIARLLDGGTTDDGAPYFVLEYVEGIPIHTWCESHHASIEQRCELFRKVCEAVSYAHRNLVIHRDLKPSHVLVDQDGTPKLLDFGIAKLLSPDGEPAASSTRTLHWALTPEYASPEQVRGEPVTTATDIYSLGAVLYQLLSGESPHHLQTHTPSEVEQVICHDDIPKPSAVVRNRAWRRRLSGDLDNIVLMAMRKEPARRYGSVDQLSEDLRRDLAGLPVAAREDTLRYRAGKFLKRHRAWTAAGLFMAISLFTGTAVAIRYAQRAHESRLLAEQQRERAELARRQADLERSHAEKASVLAQVEAREATAQRAVAEERLVDLLELANRSVFDVQGAIERLPGATEARQQIAKTTLEFLDGLAHKAAHDQRLMRVLSGAYMRLGDVQGLPLSASLGNTAEALESYHKAYALLKKLPPDPELRVRMADIHYRIGQVLITTSRTAEGITWYERGLNIAQELQREQPGNAEAVRVCAVLEWALAEQYKYLDERKATVFTNAQLASYRKLLSLRPDDDEAAHGLSSAYTQVASASSRAGRLEEAIAYAKKSVEIREQLCKRHPHDTDLKRDLMLAYGHVGDWTGYPLAFNLGDLSGAKRYFEQARKISEEMVAADPANRMAQGDLSTVLIRLGVVMETPEDRAESLAALRRAAHLSEELAKSSPRNRSVQLNLMLAYEYIGTRLAAGNSYEDGLAYYARSVRVAEQLLSEDPRYWSAYSQLSAVYKWVALVRAKQGDRTAALAQIEQARATIKRAEANGLNGNTVAAYPPKLERWLGLVYETLAQNLHVTSEQRLADWKRGRDAYARSAALWAALDSEIRARYRIDIAQVAREIEACDRQIRLIESD